MTRAVTFLHAADLHLDSPFKGLSDIHDEIFDDIRMSTFHAFDRLVDAAIENEVDFVLLVGDLFDNERQSLKAQLHLRDGFERLKNERINVYISYGNHDFFIRESSSDRISRQCFRVSERRSRGVHL